MSNHIDGEFVENSLSNSKKRNGGRPKNAVWQHFEYSPSKHAGHFGAKCKACNRQWNNAVVNKLQIHLAHECESISEDIKKVYSYIVAERDGVKESLEITAFKANTQSSLDSFWDKDEALSKERIGIIDRSILKAFVVCGLPFRIIENPFFINMLKNIRSNYNPPSRNCLSTKLLLEEAVRVDIKINNVLEKSNNLTLGMNILVY